jgi:dTDP-4-dehydrorhamnose reductase
MERRRLLIAGASGFLGSTVVLEAVKSNMWDVTAVSLNHDVTIEGVDSILCDLSDPREARQVIERQAPSAVINCAAMASVDGCEAQRDLATRLNADAPGVMAVACSNVAAKMVHVSTDAVFGGTPPPYLKDSQTSPLNWYGETKLAGEHAALAADCAAAIVRTNIVGWSPLGTHSLLEFFANRFDEGSVAPGFDDVEFRPATTPQVARVLLDIALSSDIGLIHATGDQLISKFEFGKLVATTLGFGVDLVARTSISKSGLTARRADCLDVLPSMDIPAVRDNINLERGMIEIRDLKNDGVRRRLQELAGTAA